MKFYDLIIKHLKIEGLINSIFKLSNDENKVGIEFDIKEQTIPFVGYDKTKRELVGSNDGVNFFPLYAGEGSPFIIEKQPENKCLYVDMDSGFPVGIISPNNVVIPLQKETVKIENENYIIQLTAYLSYSGLKEYSGTWKVCVVSSGRGAKGDPGESLKIEIGNVSAGNSPSVELVGESPNQTLNFILPTFWNSFEIVKESQDRTITVSTNAIPVMLKTNNGKYYNIKGREITLNENKTKFVIDISNALAVNNLIEFSGVWEVYFAGSAKQTSNIIFTPSTHGVCKLNSSNSEITFETYLIDSNFINIYCNSQDDGNFVVKILNNNVEIKKETLQTSTKMMKNTISFDEPITGNVKIVKDYENEFDEIDEVNIYKIEG